MLSAKAMYDDAEGDDRTAEGDSARAVREAPTSNVPPTFPMLVMLVGEMNTNQTREDGGKHARRHEFWCSRYSQ